MDAVRRELEEEQGALDRLRREAATRAEQDRGSINQLREELARIKTRLEEARLVLQCVCFNANPLHYYGVRVLCFVVYFRFTHHMGRPRYMGMCICMCVLRESEVWVTVELCVICRDPEK